MNSLTEAQIDRLQEIWIDDPYIMSTQTKIWENFNNNEKILSVSKQWIKAYIWVSIEYIDKKTGKLSFCKTITWSKKSKNHSGKVFDITKNIDWSYNLNLSWNKKLILPKEKISMVKKQNIPKAIISDRNSQRLRDN